MILKRVSASQVESFARCPRYWYNRSILKIESPQTEAQKRGSDIHLAIENYLQAKTFDTQWQAIITAAAGLLPTPNHPHVLIEHEFSIETFAGGPPWIGYIDLLEFERKPMLISDYKTTSDFKWAKTAEDLRTNTQLCSYSKYVLDVAKGEGAEEVDVRHVYIRTKGAPKALEVMTRLGRSEVQEVWERDMETVKEMVEWAAQEPATAEELPPNTDACSMYGGCQFKDKCNISPFKGLAMSTTQGPSTLLQKLAAKNAAAAAAPAAPTPTAVPAPAPTSTPSAPAPSALASMQIFSPGQNPIADMLLVGKAAGTSVTHEGLVYAVWASGHYTVAPDTTPAVAAVTPVAAPSAVAQAAPAPTSTPAVEAAAPAAGGKLSLKERLALKNSGAAAPAPAAEPAPAGQTAPGAVLPPDAPSRTTTPEEVAVATAPKEKKNGKAKKSEAAAPAGETAPSFADAVQGGVDGCPLEVIYVDCLPIKGGEDYTLAEDLIASVTAEVASKNGVEDWRMISYTAKGHFATVLRSKLARMPRTLVVSSGTSGSETLLEVLTPHAKKIIRALRF